MAEFQVPLPAGLAGLESHSDDCADSIRRWIYAGRGPSGCHMVALEGSTASIPASFLGEFRAPGRLAELVRSASEGRETEMSNESGEEVDMEAKQRVVEVTTDPVARCASCDGTAFDVIWGAPQIDVSGVTVTFDEDDAHAEIWDVAVVDPGELELVSCQDCGEELEVSGETWQMVRCAGEHRLTFSFR
jgi:hypothetical protein